MARSPLLATMPYVAIRPHPSSSPLTDWDAKKDLLPMSEESHTGLVENLRRRGGHDDVLEELDAQKEGSWDAATRKRWIGIEKNRKSVLIGKDDLVRPRRSSPSLLSGLGLLTSVARR